MLGIGRDFELPGRFGPYSIVTRDYDYTILASRKAFLAKVTVDPRTAVLAATILMDGLYLKP